MCIQKTVKDFIVNNFLFGDDRGLEDDSSFIGEGIIDSTGIMQLVAFLGEEFSIVIEDVELVPENLDSISKVTNFIKKKKPDFPANGNFLIEPITAT
jgi:acyl carrier protein